MAKRKNNSLFVYTALIFIVAIIMIIIAFFGQSNIRKNQPMQSQETLNSISEKASQLSEDNRILMNENKTLLEENRMLRTEIDALNDANTLAEEKISIMQKQIENGNKLMEIYELISNKYYKKARTMLEEIYVEELTTEQKSFYRILNNKVN